MIHSKKTSTLAALVGYNHHGNEMLNKKKRQEMHAKQWSNCRLRSRRLHPAGMVHRVLAARRCQEKMSTACHLLQKTTRCVSTRLGHMSFKHCRIIAQQLFDSSTRLSLNYDKRRFCLHLLDDAMSTGESLPRIFGRTIKIHPVFLNDSYTTHSQ